MNQTGSLLCGKGGIVSLNWPVICIGLLPATKSINKWLSEEEISIDNLEDGIVDNCRDHGAEG